MSMEVICISCDGLGEERRKLYSASELLSMGSQAAMGIAQQNVYGWDLHYDKGYMRRRCGTCNGEGFRPTGVSVPLVP